MLYFTKKDQPIPQGYKKINDKILLENYLNMDLDNNFIISKNEWMITFIKILANDIKSMEKEAPDSILDRIKELSDEFDRYDKDGNKYLEFKEFKDIISNNVYISE
ncbi:hypothetical protein J6G99_05565 [bacterium]|nr:hypothetical protein [bacterium]